MGKQKISTIFISVVQDLTRDNRPFIPSCFEVFDVFDCFVSLVSMKQCLIKEKGWRRMGGFLMMLNSLLPFQAYAWYKRRFSRRHITHLVSNKHEQHSNSFSLNRDVCRITEEARLFRDITYTIRTRSSSSSVAFGGWEKKGEQLSHGDDHMPGLPKPGRRQFTKPVRVIVSVLTNCFNRARAGLLVLLLPSSSRAFESHSCPSYSCARS
jgi:hypothetical protein